MSMSTRRILRSLVFALTLAVGGSALAAPPNIPARQTEIRGAIDGLKIDVANERVVLTDRGRRDLVLFARTADTKVVAELRKAFVEARRLDNGYEVVGWARMAADGSYNFSFEKDGEVIVANVQADGNGTRIEVRGQALNRSGGIRNPLEPIPSKRGRLSRGSATR